MTVRGTNTVNIPWLNFTLVILPGGRASIEFWRIKLL